MKDGVEEDFKQYISESNKILSKIDGFISRRLLKSNDGTYKIMVEHQSIETFQKMHETPEHDKVREVALSYMKSNPMPAIFNVLAS